MRWMNYNEDKEWGIQHSNDTPIKIDMSNETKTKSKFWSEDQGVELVIKAESQLERDYVHQSRRRPTAIVATGITEPFFKEAISTNLRSYFSNQKDCRRAKLEMDWFEFEFDESCLVGPTTQEEINLVTRLPKKTKQLADWVEPKHQDNGTDKTGELATVVVGQAAGAGASRFPGVTTKREGQNEELAMSLAPGVVGWCFLEVIRTINGADEVLDYPGGVWRMDVGTVRGLDKRTEEQRIQDKEDGGLQEEKKETGQRSKTEKQRIEDIGVKEAPIKARSFISLNNKSIIKE
ncbi:hypothetical protein BY996DRAFT_6523612 [Phakopsora pachyrhizi]|nr:hypothetical protein BY996DRAFT_6523612 [Phakopsora pachyrhizi]